MQSRNVVSASKRYIYKKTTCMLLYMTSLGLNQGGKTQEHIKEELKAIKEEQKSINEKIDRVMKGMRSAARAIVNELEE